MEKKLYVGNLPYSVNRESLQEMFSKYGEVTDVFIVKDRETGRPRGFAFVTFAEAADADKAIAELNEKEIEGRQITVAEARESSGGGRGRF
jgi:RNA recognition motif-containing protein